ncbi:MAG: amidotransferase 1, exosortase A system-associated [Gammaproteobacteria bacterium]|nr:amidotransferase 1, exosortase A system-associated [Gammaproteobacteria bacterium]NNL50312.1 amidotransferase 1, exosortase A system-associated [Woeseiaceae bacterium]
MCGFVGIFDLTSKDAVDRRLLDRMNTAQAHRGPDGEGLHLEPGLGLGHRRLSIIDLEAGAQPFFSDDQSVVVVYNGEIYNFRSIARDLEEKGYRFRTRCDTEVIVYAWQEWGVECLHRFRGMFAFALWDRNQQTLFVARDRIGIKPVYYTVAGGKFLVASELNPLRLSADVSRRIDESAVEDFFAFGYIPDPKTIFDGVHKLAPGHYMCMRRGTTTPEQVKYWDVPFGEARFSGSGDQAAEELMERLSESVKLRLISDVPLGAFLSGGIDSSAVVASMSELSNSPVTTCSISFGDPEFNESKYASQVAGQFRTDHHSEQVEHDDYSLLPRLSGVYGEPFADSSAIPTFRVCELARKHVTVALSGDGGDENLAGYRRYRWFEFEEKFRRVLPEKFRASVFGLLGAAYPKADWAPRIFRAKATLQAIARSSIEGYFHGVSITDEKLRSSLFSDSLLGRLDGYRAMSVFEEHAKQFKGSDTLSLVQYLDFKTYLPGDILTKVDRASMANSLEVRVPLLDHKLVEWIASLPPEMKLRSGEGKYVFKQALQGTLPNEVLYRSKMGFAVPLGSWFRGPLRDVARKGILSAEMLDSGLFSHATLSRILDEHAAGTRDFSTIIWALLMFSQFLQTDVSMS